MTDSPEPSFTPLDLAKVAHSKFAAADYAGALRLYEAVIELEPTKTETLHIRAAQACLRLYGHDMDIRRKVAARDHLEAYLEKAARPSPVAAQLLLRYIYFSIGPVAKAAPLAARFDAELSKEDRARIQARLKSSADYGEAVSEIVGRRETGAMIEEIERFEDMDSVIDRFLLADNPPQHLIGGGRVFTFGSCFAENLARALKIKGADVNSFWTGEEVNTCFSNANLVKFLLGLDVPHRDYYADVIGAFDVDALQQSLKTSKVVVYTLGIASAFFSDSGEYIPHNRRSYRALRKNPDVEFRFSTVDENVASLEAIWDLLQRETSVEKLVVTVSPVPLSASLGQKSAISADVESKSILRAAAGAFARAHSDNVIYFPSFEYFRWTALFTKETAFGEDDGYVRHPNRRMVDRIVDSFIRLYQ